MMTQVKNPFYHSLHHCNPHTCAHCSTHKILLNKKVSSQLASSQIAEKENEHKAALKKIAEEPDVSSPKKLDSASSS